MARLKKAETLLREALEKDDNLAILKAHRRIVVNDLINCIDFSEKVKLSTSLTQINREIIKLEGSKEVKDTHTENSFNEDEELRNNPLGG